MIKDLEYRDHRNVGPRLDLFLFHQLSPGSCFFLPHGAKIYNKLIALMRKQYIAYGFTEVISPNIFNLDLWWISGHAIKYRENMFMIDIENQ
jgi:threonyl-tRNA synthetase